MTYTIQSKVLLNHSHEIPLLGLGTWAIRKKNCDEVIQWAFDSGYRHIDTASYYKNENEIGDAIKNINLERESVFITSKIWPSEFKDPERAFETSLKKLKLDYLDLYLIHWPSASKTDLIYVWKNLIKFYESGQVKSIGVSNFNSAQIYDLISETEFIPDVNQIEMHPFNYQSELETINFCRDENIHITAYSPLTEGQKLNDYNITQIAKLYDKSNAQILLRWGLQHGFSIIPRSKNKNRIEENSKIFDFEISEEDMNFLDKL